MNIKIFGNIYKLILSINLKVYYINIRVCVLSNKKFLYIIKSYKTFYKF